MTSFSPRFASNLPMHVRRVRSFSLVLPVLYAAGVWIAAAELAPASGALGSALIVLALFAAVFGLQRTGVHRVATERPEFLDDGERLIRDRVLAQAYRVFATLMVLGLVYADIGADLNRKFGWSLPMPQDDLLYATGAVILLALLLPSAMLAWRLPAEELTGD